MDKNSTLQKPPHTSTDGSAEPEKTTTKRIRRQYHPQHKEHRTRLFQTDPTCFWCGTPVSDKPQTRKTGTLDHIIPIHAIGHEAETPENWVLSCNDCQKARGNKGTKNNPFFPHAKILEQMTRKLRSHKLEETEENYVALLPDWNKKVLPTRAQIALFLKYGKNHEVPEKFYLKTLIATANPLTNPPWFECEEPITHEEIQKAIQTGKLEPIRKMAPKGAERAYHIGRIAYFAVTQDNSPIEIDVGIPGMYEPNWIITDGNHRLAARIFRNRRDITVLASGALSRIAQYRVKPQSP